MYDFRPAPGTPKPDLYRDLLAAADALTAGESDRVANMANVAALLWEFLEEVNWTGFYCMSEGLEDSAQTQLVLGPFAGRPACIRIDLGSGVCGVAAQSQETQLVDDVEQFPGHIACDGDTKSELVVPVIKDGKTIAVIDLDSPRLARFDAQDARGIEALADMLAARIAP